MSDISIRNQSSIYFCYSEDAKITNLLAKDARIAALEAEVERWKLWYAHWSEWADYNLPDPPQEQGDE